MNFDYIEGYLNGIGIKTRATRDSFLPFGTVMEKVCSRWDGMSENDRENLEIVLGGDVIWQTSDAIVERGYMC